MTKFTIEQCQPDFSRALSMRDADSTALEQKEWTQLFPVVKKMVSHFKCLPQSLMIFNAYNWYAAEAVLNEHLKDVPSLFLQDYDKQCLFGRLTIDSAGKGNVSEGLISKLDNGVLVLHISPLLSIPQLWFSLKRFLLTQQVNVQSAVNATRFKGELQQIQEKKLSTKIILVANRFQLDELTQIDPEFTQIQSIFCELPNDIISNDHNIVALKTFCQNLISEKQLPPLSDDAFNCLFADLSKYCEHQKRILFAPELIENTLRYAQLFSNNEKELPQKALQQAFNIQDDAQSQARQFSEQALLEKQINIQLSGESVGQINGLSVVELMGYPTEFGEVFRISASDMMGDGEIVDVERKVELAGNIHAKSTLIVQGYINHFFTHLPSFPLSCNLVFEQSYQESDGDSASLAMLLAVTSSYSVTPLLQNVFVTGALDQHGNVLAIGGINYKIKSVTRLFALGLLSNPVTIIMPKANQINLTLDQETLVLLAAEKINIHGIEHSKEAFPLAMNCTFKETIEKIDKRISLLLQKSDQFDEDPPSFINKISDLFR